MNKKELVRFERISHILIEEGFGDFFVKSGIIDKLSVTDKMQLFFEKKLSLAHRIKAAAIRGGPTFVHFVKYLSTRTDVLEPRLAYQLADIELTEIKKQGRIEIPQITINKKVFAHLTEKPVYFDGFSYRCSLRPKSKAKKGEKPLEMHFLEKKTMSMYEQDLNILLFFAQIIDSQCKFKFHSKRVVHDYMVLVHQQFHLKKHISYAEKLKGALHTKNVTLPIYLQKASTDTHLILEKTKGIAADEIPKAIMAYHDHNKELIKNLTTLLFSPIFTHGFLLSEIGLDNIILQKKGVVGLNHVPELIQLQKVEVAQITTFLSGLLTRDADEIITTFTLNPKKRSVKKLNHTISKMFLTHKHLQTKHIEEILELIHAEQKIQPHFFEMVQLMHLCEEIQYHFQIRRTVLKELQPHIEKSLKNLTKNEVAHSKKLTKAQQILLSEQNISTEIKLMHASAHKLFSHMTTFGFMLVLLLTFFLILELTITEARTLEILIIFVACFLLTRVSKWHIFKHKA